MEDLVQVSFEWYKKPETRFQMLEVSGSAIFSERGRLSLQTSAQQKLHPEQTD